jgi:hypothetical protein
MHRVSPATPGAAWALSRRGHVLQAGWLGANEVLSSDHKDSVDLATVQGEVRVHQLAQYMRLQTRDPHRDFCTRVHYMVRDRGRGLP